MIADKISNIYRYTGIHENIIKALEAIKEYAAKPELEDGVYEVVPGEIILHVITKETHKRCDAKMEMHKNFMDIHYMIDGEESCFLSELPSLDEIEYDVDDTHITATANKNEYIVEGRAPLEELTAQLHIPFNDDRFETLNGFLMSIMERVPQDNDHFVTEYEGWRIRILSVKDRQVQRVLFTKLS